jgi:hypothetical protein
MADVVDSMNDMLKVVYPDGIPDLVPNDVKLQKALGQMKESELIGDSYQPMVRLAYPSGFTHALGDGTAGAFSLNEATAGVRKKATIQGAQILLKDQMSYEDASKAVKGKRAFADAMDEMFQTMQMAAKKRLETNLYYGNSGIGIVDVYTSGDPSVTIQVAEWAAGIWTGMEGAYVDVHSGTTSTVRGTVSIVSVDVDNRKITLSGTVTSCASGDVIYWKGGYAKEMNGIYKILSNSGSLFGIDAATYGLWAGTSYTCGSAAFSFEKFKAGIAQAVNKGLSEDLLLYINPKTWDDLMADIASLRVTTDKDVKKVDIGAEQIVFHSQNGKTVIEPSYFVKEGVGFGICKSDWKRVGSTDWTFNTPGFGGKMFFHLTGNAGVESRAYTNQAVYCNRPARSLLFTGIVNSD